MEKEEKGLNIELKQEIAVGSYSNMAIITHSHSEFILDFTRILPGMPKPEVCNRIIMTPEHAKRLLNALTDNISKYESNFGPIDMGDRKPGKEATFNLGDFTPFNNGAKS